MRRRSAARLRCCSQPHAQRAPSSTGARPSSSTSAPASAAATTPMRACCRATWASIFPAIRRSCRRTWRAAAACGSPISSTMPRPRTAPPSPPSTAAPASIRCSATRARSSTPPSSTGSAAPTTRSASASPGTRPASTDTSRCSSKRARRRRDRPGADTYQFPKIANGVLGTKFKIVTGYPGGNDIDLAMERGEVQGRCGWSWTSVKATHPTWLAAEEDQHPVPDGTVQASRPAGRAADHGPRQDRRGARDLQAHLRPAGDGLAVCRAARRAGGARRRCCARPSWRRCRTRISWPSRQGQFRDPAGGRRDDPEAGAGDLRHAARGRAEDHASCCNRAQLRRTPCADFVPARALVAGTVI